MSGKKLLVAINEIGWFAQRLAGSKIVEASVDRLNTEMELNPDHASPLGLLHGGCAASLVEATSVALIKNASPNRLFRTINMNINMVNGTKINDTLLARGNIVRIGRSIVFTKVTIFRKSNGDPVAEANVVHEIL